MLLVLALALLQLPPEWPTDLPKVQSNILDAIEAGIGKGCVEEETKARLVLVAKDVAIVDNAVKVKKVSVLDGAASEPLRHGDVQCPPISDISPDHAEAPVLYVCREGDLGFERVRHNYGADQHFERRGDAGVSQDGVEEWLALDAPLDMDLVDIEVGGSVLAGRCFVRPSLLASSLGKATSFHSLASHEVKLSFGVLAGVGSGLLGQGETLSSQRERLGIGSGAPVGGASSGLRPVSCPPSEQGGDTSEGYAEASEDKLQQGVEPLSAPAKTFARSAMRFASRSTARLSRSKAEGSFCCWA